jgi:hypothetical protein
MATATKNAPKNTPRKTREEMPMSEAIVKYASAKNIGNADKAGKAMRSRIRSLLADDDARSAFVKAWPALDGRSKGDRYNTIPVAAFEGLVNGDFRK